MSGLNFKKLLFLVGIIVSTSCLFAQNEVSLSPDLYKASTIPDSLKENAESVVRYSSEEYTIEKPGKETIKERYILTLLNEKAEHEAELFFHYDKKFNAVRSVNISFYDRSGKLIKHYRKSDLYDHAMYDGISILTDDRVLYLKHEIVSYPITMSVEAEYTRNGYITLGDWQFMKFNQAVQYASCKVSVNTETGMKFRNYHTDVKPTESMNDGLQTFFWEVKNKKACAKEPGSKAWACLPRIDFSPLHFIYDNRPGNFDSWNNFGKWLYALNSDVCSLSPEREQEIRQMTDSLKTDKEKAKFLYEYLQKNIRYVSIQLGIGGLKPFPASFVDEKKYGDCKALANYMCALLKAVNIKSYYTVVRAGENAESPDPDFVSNRSNHVILCIPFPKDTTWLECTSNTQPFGQLGAFTENRYALMITEDGGKLVKTPGSVKEENSLTTEVTVSLAADGSATAQLKGKATGEYREMFIDLSLIRTDDQKSYLIRDLNLKQPDIFDLKYGNDSKGVKEFVLDVKYEKFVDMMVGDNKLFCKPRLFSLWSDTCPEDKKRTTDFYFSFPLVKTSVTTFKLPEGFEPESIPQNISLKFSSGSFETTYSYDKVANTLKSVSSFQLDNHVIPASKYSEMQQFMDNISRLSGKELIIQKKG